ncbi:hypothetical protein [Pantoea sp. UBA4549]|uniref:hypothetical protein n=1 Tax=Pantoea sp. UBA4549 TaxID=1947033 RepID=UPI002600F05C|nr:hypothetical protein [Pantoea sp. UBA4549]
MTLALNISPQISLDELRLIVRLGLLPKPAGVRYDYYYLVTPGQTFGFSKKPSVRGFASKFNAACQGCFFEENSYLRLHDIQETCALSAQMLRVGSERFFGGTSQADDLTSQVTDAFLRGWGIVGPSENPSMEDFNAAMYILSQFIAYQHQMGVPEWDSAQEYYVGSLYVRNGDAYSSIASNNINSPPPSSKWAKVINDKNGLLSLGLSDANGFVGRLINIQIFTASGVYTPTAGAKKCIIEAVSGGGGGGSVINISSGQTAVGNGGVSGEYVKAPLLTAQAKNMIIGSPGAGGTSGNPGGAGGVTSVGNLISLRGGSGGGAGAASTTNTIGTTSGSPTGTFAYPIDSVYQGNSLGPRGVIVNPRVSGGALAGTGGSSPFGKGGDGTNVSSSGNDASGNGAGGAGAINIGASATRTGGAGTGGLVIIWEYV